MKCYEMLPESSSSKSLKAQRSFSWKHETNGEETYTTYDTSLLVHSTNDKVLYNLTQWLTLLVSNLLPNKVNYLRDKENKGLCHTIQLPEKAPANVRSHAEENYTGEWWQVPQPEDARATKKNIIPHQFAFIGTWDPIASWPL